MQVPFIAYYRQDYYMPDLEEQDLWIIWDWYGYARGYLVAVIAR